MAEQEFDYITVEPCGGGKFGVYGHGVYPDWSVFAGRPRRAVLDIFPTLEEAQEEWPFAEVLDHSTKVRREGTLAEMSGLPDSPPSWFDPADCGETW